MFVKMRNQYFCLKQKLILTYFLFCFHKTFCPGQFTQNVLIYPMNKRFFLCMHIKYMYTPAKGIIIFASNNQNRFDVYVHVYLKNLEFI